MPLNILHHKSWNIYNKETQARIARDEAEAQAREEAYNQRLQEYGAAKRLATLQGRSPPPPLEPLEHDSRKRHRRDNEHHRPEPRDKHRKRAKLQGEDDTDRDLRLAKAQIDNANAAKERTGSHDAEHRARRSRVDAPLTGEDGHINLFYADAKAPRDFEQEFAQNRKQHELENQAQMRLNNAAERGGSKEGPWYSNALAGTLADTNRIARSIDPAQVTEEKPQATGGLLELYHKPSDAWGRPDSARKEREKARLAAADPLATMQLGWKKTKEYREAKAEWEKQRKEELKKLEKEQRRQDREQRRRDREQRSQQRRHEGRRGRRGDDAESLEGFSLDAPVEECARDKHSRRSLMEHREKDGRRDRDMQSRRHKDKHNGRYKETNDKTR